jgi:protein O-GlcNAc transferase
VKPSGDAALEAFRIGAAHHQAGALAAAEAAYRRALSVAPHDADCLHMMGMLAFQTGRSDLAVQHLRRAVALKPSAADYHKNLGGVLRELGLAGDAITAYRKALRRHPRVPEIHRNLGCALSDTGQLERAADSFRTAAGLNPCYVDAANDLGNVWLFSTGRRKRSPASRVPSGCGLATRFCITIWVWRWERSIDLTNRSLAFERR